MEQFNNKNNKIRNPTKEVIVVALDLKSSGSKTEQKQTKVEKGTKDILKSAPAPNAVTTVKLGNGTVQQNY